MRSVKTLPLILGATAILGVAVLLSAVVYKLQPTNTGLDSRSTPEKPVDVVRMNGLSYTAQEGDKIRFRLKADQVEVARRKFGMLYVTPLKEATLSNVELELYAREGEEGAEDILSMDMLGQLLPADALKELGIITRVRIDGLSIKRIRGQAVSSITAQYATIDPRTRVAELTGGVLVVGADGRSIRSQSTTWDPAAGLFTIDGPYLLVKKAGQVVQGNGARFDAELRGVRS
jgi:hypothetical protein